MRTFTRITIPYNDLCTSGEYRFYEISDFFTRVLIVAISIDDDVRSEHEPMHDTMVKRYTEATICLEFDDMMYS